MKKFPLPLLLFAAALVAPTPAQAEVTDKTVQWSVGDVYQLEVTVSSTTFLETRLRNKRETSDSNSTFTYSARVEVLEVDETGEPSKESHTHFALVINRDGQELKRAGNEAALIAGLNSKSRPTFHLADERLRGAAAEVLEDVIILQPAGARATEVSDRRTGKQAAMKRTTRLTDLAVLRAGDLQVDTSADPQQDSFEIAYILPLKWIEPETDDANLRFTETSGMFSETLEIDGAKGSWTLQSQSTCQFEGFRSPTPTTETKLINIQGPRFTIDYNYVRTESRTPIDSPTLVGASAAAVR